MFDRVRSRRSDAVRRDNASGYKTVACNLLTFNTIFITGNNLLSGT